MKRSHLILTILIPFLTVAAADESVMILSNHQTAPLTEQEISAACDYLISNYNSTIGLVKETPTNQTYWLYSDNLLALVALSYCRQSFTVQAIRMNISDTRWKYEYPNQYLVLETNTWAGMREGQAPFNASRAYHIHDSVWATINNESSTLSPYDYADIGFLQVLFLAQRVGNTTQAGQLFDQTLKMYDGIGFNDTAFHAQYQTYKLALYIIAARTLNRPVQLSALVTLSRMQDKNGGFHTGYVSDFSTNGTLTNTETTSLAILALGSLSPPSWLPKTTGLQKP